MSLLIGMMGLPRSGKTTAAQSLHKTLGAPIVNRDSIRLALHGRRYVEVAEPMVRAIAQCMVRALFLAGHEVVIVDETNLRRKTRDMWKDEAWNTEFLHVDTPAEICVERAQAQNDSVIIPVIRDMAEGIELLGEDEQHLRI